MSPEMTTEQLRLSKAEMAVLLQHFWGEAAAPTETMMTDLSLDEAALASGRRSLVGRELLLKAPRGGGAALSPLVEPVLATSTRPQVLGVLQITGPGTAPRSGYFSWTPAMIVFNHVTETGDLMLETLSGVEAIANATLRFSDLTPFKKAKAEGVADPEAIVREAKLRAVFLAVSDPAAVKPATEAMAWLVSRGEIWLMEAGEGEVPQLMPASAAEVGRKVVSLMNTAVEHLQAERSSPVTHKGDRSGEGKTVKATQERRGR